MNNDTEHYDVVIVGTGIAGAILAKQLGALGHTVLLLEAGVAIPDGRQELLEKFYLDTLKLPESPYPANPNAPAASVQDLFGELTEPSHGYLDQSEATTPFGSTYERRAGGTMWHWMGTSMRLLPGDFELESRYGHGADWPIRYRDLGIEADHDDQRDATNGAASPAGGNSKRSYYDLAEDEIGVSANVKDQITEEVREIKNGGKTEIKVEQLYRQDREYPMPAIPLSKVDQFFKAGVWGMKFEDMKVWHFPTPAGRNSRPYKNRRACAGNTNCVPICPIQAKYDPTVTLFAAFNHSNVSARFQSVVTNLKPVGGRIAEVEYVEYDEVHKTRSKQKSVSGTIVVLAANGIETPKLLLLSRKNANKEYFKSEHIGKYLMDHPFYLRWGLAPTQVFPYRGPLSTSGLDGLRDGEFRRKRAAFRIEIGNDGWRLTNDDPAKTLLDLVEKNNFGPDLVRQLNDIYTRQVRIGFELEQLPDKNNCVDLSSQKDALGIPRPKIMYSLAEYEAAGFAAAARFTQSLFARLGIDDKTHCKGLPTVKDWQGGQYEFMGAGHIMGTCRMGSKESESVVDADLRCHEFKNLYIVGSSVFPTGGTANPTLTIAALAFRAADKIHSSLKTGV